METRPFGTTGLRVSALGLGAGQVGDARLDESDASRLLHAALDLGVTLIDTARGYGLSEERIGRHLADRRAQFVLSTKVGYGIPGYADWSYDSVLAGVDTALHLMRTDWLDIVHLHSCPLEVLWHHGVVDALERAREAGKVRVVAYAGDNEPLEWALYSRRFGGLMHSVSPFDQRALDRFVPTAQARGIGVIAKRSVGNAPWLYADCPHGQYVEPYWHRWQALRRDLDLDWPEVALRFTAFADGVACALVGTKNPAHLAENVRRAEEGPLDPAVVRALRDAFRRHDDGWVGQV